MPTPKSKDSKRKLRRWQYEVRATRDDRSQVFQAPAVTIGTSQDARTTARQIREDLARAPQFEGATLAVTPIGHETVSRTILTQLTGLQDENRLLTRVIKDLVSEQIRQERGNADAPTTPFEDQVRERMGQAYLDARKAMIAEQQAKTDEVVATLSESAPAEALADVDSTPLETVL